MSYSLSDVRPSDIDLSSVATKLPSTEKGEDSVHFHVTGKYCKGCAQIRLRNAEEAFRVVKDETVQLSHDWEELIGEILLEYGINRYEPKFRRDERQTHELAPFPTVQEVQARMSSARERGVRPGYLSGTNPWQTIANIQRFAHAVNEARGASRPSSRTGEIDVRTKQNAAVLRTLRAKAGETADIEKEMAAIEADLEHEARRTKRALDRRGMFEPEMNEVRVRTMQRVAHRDRIMQQRAGPARAQHLSHAAQGETAQKRSRNAVGVLDRLDALLKVIDAVESGKPTEHVDIINKETERISNRARMVIGHTRVLLSVNQQESSARGAPTSALPGQAPGSAAGARAEKERAEKAARVVGRVRNNIARIRDEIEAHLLERFSDVVELVDDGADDSSWRRTKPIPREDYGKNGLELLEELGVPFEYQREPSAEIPSKAGSSSSGFSDQTPEAPAALEGARGSTQDLIKEALGGNPKGRIRVARGQLVSAMSTIKRPLEGFLINAGDAHDQGSDIIRQMFAKQARIQCGMDTPTDKEEGPRPEDYAHLDTEGLLEVSAKGLIRAMELMGDMTRLSSLANTAYDPVLLARRRNAGPIDSVKSGAPSDGPATPGPGSTVKQPFLAAATSAGDIRGRHLGDVLEEPHAETPEDQPTGSLVYGPVSQTPSPPQTPEKPSALKEDSEAGTKAEEQPSVRDRVPSNWEEVAWGKNKPPAAAEPPLQQAPGAAAPGPGPAAAAESSEEGQGRRSVARLAEDPLDVMEASLVGAGTLARRGAPERVSMYAPRVRAADGGAFGRRLGTPPQSMYSMALHARLERVWSILRMPASVKATMAEKYARSGSPWASRFEEAVMVWETGASAVLERERALAEFASLTQELVSAAAAGGRVKHSAAEAMESVCARLLYAHQLCIDIAALLEDTFDESFSLAGQPYPPEAEKITPDGLRQVVEYAWALCEGDDPDDAREDTPQGHAEIGSEAAQPRLPPLHGSGASRGGLGTSGAEMRGGSGGGPERRAVELRGGSRGADILRLEDAAEVTSVEAHHLPPVQARGNSAQEPLQEPSLQTGLGQGGDASGEASFYVSSSAREACMSEPSFAPAGAAAPGAEASLSSAVIDGRQCAAGKAGPSGRAVIEISAGGTPGEDRWRGPSRGHTPGTPGSRLSALSRESMRNTREHTRLYDRTTKSRLLHTKRGIRQFADQRMREDAQELMKQPHVAAAVRAMESRDMF